MSHCSTRLQRDGRLTRPGLTGNCLTAARRVGRPHVAKLETFALMRRQTPPRPLLRYPARPSPRAQRAHRGRRLVELTDLLMLNAEPHLRQGHALTGQDGLQAAKCLRPRITLAASSGAPSGRTCAMHACPSYLRRRSRPQRLNRWASRRAVNSGLYRSLLRTHRRERLYGLLRRVRSSTGWLSGSDEQLSSAARLTSSTNATKG